MKTIKLACRVIEIPIVVVDGTVLVATIGATVAAATGATELKIGFCEREKKNSNLQKKVGYKKQMLVPLKAAIMTH